ncbi:hypothetical protein THAOC_05844 [Thalassiosira oceanica]|uniref:Complex 1 LYR protein domain-containing protein n=1 Tax=Thalassiosira oceanica TaxID=159749 RepID=K0TG69_THAOC|nr:hypothetical protein THAOC_05844 [Thalassiosira oceanica]|mmetsp:Transcript_4946/g.11124  ORF Transcript_4946/g.11124 Transcript_4946/m.11124 type:complete len:88 (+) Transcript_4946:199-462(+)|eukprot:EJK72606.1 hypothetical protein THAOC_05844 [Thalassiosira oceanica]
MSRRLSGLQKDVLALYRSILRQASVIDRQRQCKGETSSFVHAREKFRKEAMSVRRSDFKRIEYKIRKGEKQLKLMKMPGVSLVGPGA